MYDDIKDDIKEIEDNFYTELDIIKSDINNQISSINTTLTKHTTYARVEALEQKINNGTSSDTGNDSGSGNNTGLRPGVQGGISGTLNPDIIWGGQTTDPSTGNTSPVRPSTPFG